MEALTKQADGHPGVTRYATRGADMRPHKYDIRNDSLVVCNEWQGEWCWVQYKDENWYVKTRNLVFKEKPLSLSMLEYFKKEADWFKVDSGAVKGDIAKTQSLLQEIEKNGWLSAGEEVMVPEYIFNEVKKWSEYIPDYRRWLENRMRDREMQYC